MQVKNEQRLPLELYCEETDIVVSFFLTPGTICLLYFLRWEGVLVIVFKKNKINEGNLKKF